jgi:hypothetical protein
MTFTFYIKFMDTSTVAQCLRDHMAVAIAGGGRGSSG